MNVISEVFAKNRCIGCGVCAGICPVKILDMKMAKNGLFVPVQNGECLKKCDICLKNCPFYEKNCEKQSDFKNLGEIKKCFEFSLKNDADRLKSASGGAGNFILSEILKNKMASKIIAVFACENLSESSNKTSAELFKFGVFSDLNKLKNARNSAYYPLDFSQMVKFILENDETYAITALPCLAKSLRLLQKNNPKFRKRVKFIISLVCGGLKSANFTQKVANIAFKSENVKIKSINFRKKIKGKNALNFSYEITAQNAEKRQFDRFKNIDLWNLRAFTPLACNNCNDTFAPNADITLMDAWLDDKIADFRGTTLIICRNENLLKIFENSQENCAEISREMVLKSQFSVARNKFLIYSKTGNIFERKINKIKLEIQNFTAENFECENFINERLKRLEFWVKLNLKFATLKYLSKKILGKKL